VDFDEFIGHIEIPKLDNEQRSKREGLFTLEQRKKMFKIE